MAMTHPVRIKFNTGGRGEKAEILSDCVSQAAAEAGMHPAQIVKAMTYFLEAVVDKMAQNKPVSIPGFGLFAVNPWFPRKPGLQPHCYPAFSGALPGSSPSRSRVCYSAPAALWPMAHAMPGRRGRTRNSMLLAVRYPG